MYNKTFSISQLNKKCTRNKIINIFFISQIYLSILRQIQQFEFINPDSK